MRLGVVGDLHLTLDPAASASWHNPYDFAGLPDRIDRAREHFERADVDAVLVLGDVSHRGDDTSARSALATLSDGLTCPVFVVAGNHDLMERGDGLERCLPAGCQLLAGREVELEGVRLAGVAVERDPEAGGPRWSGDSAAATPFSVLASHFPVLSRAERLAEAGLKYPRDLTNREELCESVTGAGPVLVLCGHFHARESHAQDDVLQLSVAALIEAPYEAAIVDVHADDGHVRVRRRSSSFGPAANGPNPVLAPADETWTLRPPGTPRRWLPSPPPGPSRRGTPPARR